MMGVWAPHCHLRLQHKPGLAPAPAQWWGWCFPGKAGRTPVADPSQKDLSTAVQVWPGVWYLAVWGGLDRGVAQGLGWPPGWNGRPWTQDRPWASLSGRRGRKVLRLVASLGRSGEGREGEGETETDRQTEAERSSKNKDRAIQKPREYDQDQETHRDWQSPQEHTWSWTPSPDPSHVKNPALPFANCDRTSLNIDLPVCKMGARRMLGGVEGLCKT